MRWARAAAFGLTVGLAACSSIPELSFDDGAPAPGSPDAEASDARADTGGGGGGSGGVDAGPTAPAFSDAGCSIPTGAQGCCGDVPCVGDACATSCGACQKCKGKDVCCAKTGSPLDCRKKPGDC